MNFNKPSFYYKFIILLLVEFTTVYSYGQCNFSNGPEGELCSTAVYICGSGLNGYTGTLRYENSTTNIWPGTANPNVGVCLTGGTFDNTSWFSFTACADSVHLRITFNNCQHPTNNLPDTGIQTGLFTRCDKNSSVSCQTVQGQTSGVIDLIYNNFVPGDIVYFVMDGYAKSICDFKIDVLYGLDTTPVTPPDASLLANGYITGPDTVACIDRNTTITYNLIEPERKVSFNNSCAPPTTFNPSDSICYSWDIFPKSGYTFQNQDSSGTSVNVLFSEPGTYTISAQTFFNPFYVGSCANAAAGKINSWKVTVLPPESIVEPLEFVCPDQNRIFCGQLITKDTIFVCNDDPCRIVTKEFKLGTSRTADLGVQYICDGSSYIFQGNSYTQPGYYEVVDKQDCTILNKFTVATVSVNASINAGLRVLDCNNPTINLSGTGSTNANFGLTFDWRDANNQVLKVGKDLTVDKAGEYIFTTNYSTVSGTCSDWERVTITSDFSKPLISAVLPVVKCLLVSDAKPIITLISNVTLSGPQWQLPNGQIANTQNLVVDSLGATSGKPYKFTATGPNGCQIDTSFILKSNFEKANILLTGDNLTCYYPKQTVLATTNIPIDSIRWTKIAPNVAFHGSFDGGDLSNFSYDVTQPGVYKVEVMAAASKCWNDESIAIADNRVTPDLTLNNEVKWHCNTQSINISPTSSSTGNHIRFDWLTIDGSILSEKNNKDLIAGSVGTYQLIVFDKDNGCSKSGLIRVMEDTNVPTNIDFTTSDVLCNGDNNGELAISQTVGGVGPYNYYLGETLLSNEEVLGLAPGEYNLVVADMYDCRHEVKFNIQEPPILNVVTDTDINIYFSEITTLTFESNYASSDISAIIWSNSAGEILGTTDELEYQNILSDVVYLEVINLNGCTTRSKITINVDNALKVHFPNIFSPNGDGVNDRLVIGKNTIPVEVQRMAIYDRYGNKVYEQKNVEFNDETEGWDGTFNGDYVVPGVYVMILELEDFLGNKQVYKKDITIIR